MRVIRAGGTKARIKRKPQPKPAKSKHGYSARNRNLLALGFQSYRHYLKSDLWAEVRRLAFAEHGRKCRKCGAPATDMHHARYDMATLVGSDLTHLHPLCRDCHEAAEVQGSRKTNIAEANSRLGIKGVKQDTPADRRLARRFSQNKPAKPQPRVETYKPATNSRKKTLKVCQFCGKHRRPSTFKIKVGRVPMCKICARKRELTKVET